MAKCERIDWSREKEPQNSRVVLWSRSLSATGRVGPGRVASSAFEQK